MCAQREVDTGAGRHVTVDRRRCGGDVVGVDGVVVGRNGGVLGGGVGVGWVLREFFGGDAGEVDGCRGFLARPAHVGGFDAELGDVCHESAHEHIAATETQKLILEVGAVEKDDVDVDRVHIGDIFELREDLALEFTLLGLDVFEHASTEGVDLLDAGAELADDGDSFGKGTGTAHVENEQCAAKR